jgi:hypothetical protein
MAELVDKVWQQRPAPMKASLHSKVSRLEGRTQRVINDKVVLLPEWSGKVRPNKGGATLAR